MFVTIIEKSKKKIRKLEKVWLRDFISKNTKNLSLLSNHTIQCMTEKKGHNSRTTSLAKKEKNQHSHSHFDLGVHVPLGLSIWGYRSLFEGTHILG